MPRPLLLFTAVAPIVVLVACRTAPELPVALDPDDVDRACLRMTSCEPEGSESPSDCATKALTRPASGRRLTREWVACLDEARSDCAAIRACAPELEGSPCSRIDDGTLCQGDLLLSCWNGEVEFVRDCAAWDLACEVVEDQATCRGDGPSCLDGSDRCEGQLAVVCMGFREASFDCTALVDGARCTLRAGRAACLPGATSCDATTPSRCDGVAARFCSATGDVTSVSCIDLGFDGCVEQADRHVCGDPAE